MVEEEEDGRVWIGGVATVLGSWLPMNGAGTGRELGRPAAFVVDRCIFGRIGWGRCARGAVRQDGQLVCRGPRWR